MVTIHINLSRTVAPGKKSVNMVDWKYSSFSPLDLVTGLISRRPSSCQWNRVQHYGRIERFGGSISFIVHHPKPAAVSRRSQSMSIRLGGSRGQKHQLLDFQQISSHGPPRLRSIVARLAAEQRTRSPAPLTTD